MARPGGRQNRSSVPRVGCSLPSEADRASLRPRPGAPHGPGNKRIADRTGPADLAAHHQDFLDCVRGTSKSPHADATAGHRSAALVHLANIGARVGRVLHFDPQAETIVGDDEAAALVTRRYREGHWAAPKLS